MTTRAAVFFFLSASGVWIAIGLFYGIALGDYLDKLDFLILTLIMFSSV